MDVRKDSRKGMYVNMIDYKCNSPVLFIAFTREEETKLVFEMIRRVSPGKLYIASDGARIEKQGEKEKIENLRNWLVSNVDWECEVKTKFNERNLGCGLGVSSAITWFFENEDMGIILEDDCLPSISFFLYCDELLNKYKDDNRIYHIAGNNPLTYTNIPYSYYFARIQHCWGWASWRRAWEKFKFNIDDLNSFILQKKIDKIFNRNADKNYWVNIFKRMEKHEVDTWDYQWTYTIFNYDGICINPSKNLVSNIGFGVDATHTFFSFSYFKNQTKYEISDVLHPDEVVIDENIIILINKKAFGINLSWKSIVKKIIYKTLSKESVLKLKFFSIRIDKSLGNLLK